MDQATIKLIEKLEALLKKEARIPIANRFLSEQTAEIVANSWLNQSWSGVVHADLVEEGDKLHYHRVLNKVLREGLPELDAFLRKNVYASLILDLVEQEHQELLELGDMDALYLFEMAYELSKIEKGTPVHVHMLNMIAFHQKEFGTLKKLRSGSHPREEARESQTEGSDASDPDGKIEFKPSLESKNRIHDTIVNQWLSFEHRVGLKVTCILNDSRRMKNIKTDLWQKQQDAEKILESTEENCTDYSVLESFRSSLAKKRPQFRSAMGKKISSQPEVAEKVYNILDILAEREVSAFDYLDVAVALAKAEHETTISMIECDLMNQGDLFISSKEILRSLERP